MYSPEMRSLLESNVNPIVRMSGDVISGGQPPPSSALLTSSTGFFRNNDIDPKWVTIAGVFAWLALFLSVFEVLQHLLKYKAVFLFLID